MRRECRCHTHALRCSSDTEQPSQIWKRRAQALTVRHSSMSLSAVTRRRLWHASYSPLGSLPGLPPTSFTRAAARSKNSRWRCRCLICSFAGRRSCVRRHNTDSGRMSHDLPDAPHVSDGLALFRKCRSRATNECAQCRHTAEYSHWRQRFT
jgi:hypothetical protein